jgi:hypothetical protein
MLPHIAAGGEWQHVVNEDALHVFGAFALAADVALHELSGQELDGVPFVGLDGSREAGETASVALGACTSRIDAVIGGSGELLRDLSSVSEVGARVVAERHPALLGAPSLAEEPVNELPSQIFMQLRRCSTWISSTRPHQRRIVRKKFCEYSSKFSEVYSTGLK